MSTADIHAALLENPAFAGFTISQQGLKVTSRDVV